jgi:hypothetical protein
LFLRVVVPTPASPSAAELRAFFADPANFINLDTTQLFARLGPSHQYDDWDWGRFVHTWKSRELWVRVGVQGNARINYVVFAYRHKRKTIEDVVWQRPDDGRPSLYQELL